MRKGLAHRCVWSGSGSSLGCPRAFRDPAPPAAWPRWGFGGGGDGRRYRRGDLDANAKVEAPDPRTVPMLVRRRAVVTPLKQPRTKLQSARRVQSPQSDNSPDPHRGRLAVPKANRPTSLPCCGHQTAQPSTQWRRQRGGSRIRSVASSPVSFVKSSASILYPRQLEPDASIELRSCTALQLRWEPKTCRER